MEKRIYNEKNGLWYELQGDYYLPCLKVPDEKEVEIGIWGERRRQFLKEHHKVRYCNLLTSGELNSHLADIDRQAEKLFDQLVTELSEKENITEQLKAQDMMAWVRKMSATCKSRG